MAIQLTHILRVGLLFISLVVLTEIVPISVTQFQTGDACPSIGPIPACYLVTACYAAIGISATFWFRPKDLLFAFGAVPVIGLALIGTTSELFGIPTCPRSESGFPLCYTSLMIGMSVTLLYVTVRYLERQKSQTS
jgi:hypothetical protein